VLHTDEDVDASRGQTAINISEHSEAAEGEGEVRNAILGLDMDMASAWTRTCTTMSRAG